MTAAVGETVEEEVPVAVLAAPAVTVAVTVAVGLQRNVSTHTEPVDVGHLRRIMVGDGGNGSS